MSMYGLGDMARHFASSRHNADIRGRLETLAGELSTGRKSDLAAAIGGQSRWYADIDHRITVGQSQHSVAAQVGQWLDVAQLSLGAVEDLRAGLFDEVSLLSQNVGPTQFEHSATLGTAAFEDMVAALNTQMGGRSLFGGTDEDTPPLAEADVMLADIRGAVAGLTTAQDIADAIDAWFHDVGGGFETLGYQGDDGDLAARRIDDATTVTMRARADDTAIRDTLKAAALAALADDTGIAVSDAERSALVDQATGALISASQPMVELQAMVGNDQSRADDALARLTAEVSALEIMRSDMASADPFEVAGELEQMQIMLETHYAVTARMSQLSLVRYL